MKDLLSLSGVQLAALLLAAAYTKIAGIQMDDKSGIIGAIVISLAVTNVVAFLGRFAWLRFVSPPSKEGAKS